MTAPADPLPPPTVPGLSGLVVLARGGYATVYRALQESVAREVAVKIENRTLESERDRRRFLREARAAGRMSSHPHVVDLFDAGVTPDGHPFLIMELCDGSYAERMKLAPLRPVEARDVGVKIADALADAHALGVLHRDVKPANILVTRFGEPALADFGLAILAETRDASVTLDVLTPAYAPPELFRQHPPSPSVDVYALSATLYALMLGRPPRWRQDGPPSLLTLLELFNEPLPDLPGVPAELLGVLRVGMSNDPDARPSAEQLRDALVAVPLERYQAGPPHPDRPSGAPRGSAARGEASPRPAGSVSWENGPGSGASWGNGPGNGPSSGPGNGASWASGSGSASGHGASGGPATPVVGAAGGRARGTATVPPVSAAPVTPPRPTGPAPADTPTKPGSPRWRIVAAMVGALVALAVLVGVVIWLVTREGPNTPGGLPSASPTVQRESVAPGRQCIIAALDPQARCPSQPECFGAIAVTDGVARAPVRACDRAHTWETFVLGVLPATVTSVTEQAVRRAPGVNTLCSQFNLLTVVPDQVGWRVAVLPPTPEGFAAGDRTYRCLGGKGIDELTGPTLRIVQ